MDKINNKSDVNFLNPFAEVLNMPFLFIIGAPRSGSSWLHQLLASHPEVAASEATEIAHFDTYLLSMRNRWELEKENIDNRQWALGLPTIWSDIKFIEFQQYFTGAVYDAILQENPNAISILDRHAGYSCSLPLIKSFLPNAKFIHLIRDGREVVVSAISAYDRKGFGTRDVYSSSTAWVSYVTNAGRAIKYGEACYFELKYEYLLAQPEEALCDLLCFCQLDAEPALIKSICDNNYKAKVSHPNPDRSNYKQVLWKEKMSLWQKIVFNKIAGALMLELGYIKKSDRYFDFCNDSLFSSALSLIIKIAYWPRYNLKDFLRKMLSDKKN